MSSWKPKYLVLAPFRDTSTDLQLLIYDQRDLSNPPKHRIVLADARIDSKVSSFKWLSKGAIPFVIVANTRKFYLAANTKTDFDEWMELIKPENKYSPSASVSTRISRHRGRDEDVRSVYSATSEYPFDDCASVASTCRTQYLDETRSNVSNVDTLSFYADPILTPYELTLMGEQAPARK